MSWPTSMRMWSLALLEAAVLEQEVALAHIVETKVPKLAGFLEQVLVLRQVLEESEPAATQVEEAVNGLACRLLLFRAVPTLEQPEQLLDTAGDGWCDHAAASVEEGRGARVGQRLAAAKLHSLTVLEAQGHCQVERSSL